MGSINSLSYTYRFWKRDFFYSLFTGLFSTGIFFFLILSLRIQMNTSGVISFSSIEGLKNSPQLLFYLSIVSLSFLSLGAIFPRIADFGVMMAVGGNAWICIQIHIILLFLLILPGFILGNILNFVFVQEAQSNFSILNLGIIEAYTLLSSSFCILLFGIPSAWFATSRDPYTNIRRKK